MLQSIRLLTDVADSFREKCIVGIEPDRDVHQGRIWSAR